MQVAAMADCEPRMFLKTISSAPQRVGLGSTRMNNLGMLRTHVDNRERQARGHELIERGRTPTLVSTDQEVVPIAHPRSPRAA